VTRRAGEAVLGLGFEQLVRRGLRGIWLRGDVPRAPAVWAANHHSWWDGFVANAVLLRLGHVPALLMDAENLKSFGFLEGSGAIAADRPRAALQSLQAGRTLIVYPEGELLAAGPLRPLAAGAPWLARRAGVPLLAAATRIVVRGHQYPEAYVAVTTSRPDALAADLSGCLDGLDSELRRADPREPLPGFGRLVSGRRSWDERISRWTHR
jgi:1-acyl-sn-glycerol-3-phosphate acyltransferase